MYNGQKLLNSEYLLCLFLPCTYLLASLHMWEHVCIVSVLDFFCILFVDYFMMGYGLPVISGPQGEEHFEPSTQLSVC